MPASESEVLVGRRYLERGFLDAAMKLLVRNAELVLPAGHLVVSPWPRIRLEVQDGPGHTEKCLVVQLEELSPRGTTETDLKHDAS